ncbi:MAG: type I-MYXAN CRISPR-associated protein Cas5/Cmx5/DevS [Nitrososphaerota archaeon]|jgi:CRISPR-associated protein Cas5t|nr:type I-MYXAN CRISPR-associated protein Cas5/Cmx5/DevS [Nitrososphaerota archaeon]
MPENTGNIIALYVTVPVASFRNPYAREYLETYPCPPPSTVYGMLLSTVGEVSRSAHVGTEIAYALLSQPELSSIIRTKWRIKNKKRPPGGGENKVPDFQEVLTGIKMVLWIRKGKVEGASPSLAERLEHALTRPSGCIRFGAISLGESTHLVDDLRRWRKDEDGVQGRLLVQDEEGGFSLPVWADHVSSTTTHWGRYRLIEWRLDEEIPERAWITIAPSSV